MRRVMRAYNGSVHINSFQVKIKTSTNRNNINKMNVKASKGEEKEIYRCKKRKFVCKKGDEILHWFGINCDKVQVRRPRHKEGVTCTQRRRESFEQMQKKVSTAHQKSTEILHCLGTHQRCDTVKVRRPRHKEGAISHQEEEKVMYTGRRLIRHIKKFEILHSVGPHQRRDQVYGATRRTPDRSNKMYTKKKRK